MREYDWWACEASSRPQPSKNQMPDLLTDERRREILRILAEEGRVVLPDLSTRLAVSVATARRDATALAKTGFALRTRGGLLPTDYYRRELHFRAKSVSKMSSKQQIARKVTSLMPHEGNVFIDAGTTCLEAARLLLDRPNLRLYTNSIPLLALATTARATLIALGGEVRSVSLALTGALAQSWLNQLRFDVCLLGASGVAVSDGAYTTELHEAAVKTEVLRRSTFRLLAVHAAKWNQTAAIRFAPWTAISALVTDRELSRADRSVLGASGTKFILA